ncbi:TetR/AcrR family transcriptional regulator [Sphingosinicella sp. CPCC 101087]|uniref:TetR/AcrR family transcriptional regulator n=1 Tax=Sphingosinicella sp. CPCC 101087 TaxID=2497754 RepID=UPI0013ED0B27|nr:TetR/AcrR family transcriptional regulator [Sphingosinicella sp. CPCC 101087]
MASSAPLTRERILIAADDLFYAEGLAAISMDRLAARAGVTKKTLYYHFRSKDDLMGAYLEARRGPVLRRYQDWAGTTGSVGERMARMLRKLALNADDRGWRGCGFIRAACELAHLPGHPASVSARRHKAEFEAWMRAMLEEERHAHSDRLARVLMVLLDGAIVQTLIHRRSEHAEAAAESVGALLGTPASTRRIAPPGSAREQSAAA